MDGVNNGDHTPYLIDLVNQGSVIIPDFDSPIPEMFKHPEKPEHLYVPGSEEATFTLFGKLPFSHLLYFEKNIYIIHVPKLLFRTI